MTSLMSSRTVNTIMSIFRIETLTSDKNSMYPRLPIVFKASTSEGSSRTANGSFSSDDSMAQFSAHLVITYNKILCLSQQLYDQARLSSSDCHVL